MKRILVLVTSLALGWAAPAAADDILFDFDGAGGFAAATINAFDPAQGNSLSVGIDATSTVGDTGTVLFMANLSAATFNGSNPGGGLVPCSGILGTDCFTFVVAVDVIVSSTGTNSIGLSLDPNADTNVFNMYATGATGGDNLTGLGFTSGTLIASGSFETFESGFVSAPNLIQNLDNFGNNDYPNVDTIVGGGILDDGTAAPALTGGTFAGSVNINLGTLDPNYFPQLFTALLFTATSQNVVPYSTVDPSACFYTGTGTDFSTVCNPLFGANTVGAINGIGTIIGFNPDGSPIIVLGVGTMLQTDANVAFQTANVVPEPASLLLLGSGLLGAAAARRRRSRKS